MSTIKCELLDKDVHKFDCANDSIETQVEDSYYITLLKQAYAYKIVFDEIIVGYFMLHFKSIQLDSIDEINGIDYQSNMQQEYTAMHIRYLAIDSVYQHKGIGTSALKLITGQIMKLSEKYPIRLITIDAIEQYHNWYMEIGFRDFPGIKFNGTTYPMFMDCMTKDERLLLDRYCDDYY